MHACAERLVCQSWLWGREPKWLWQTVLCMGIISAVCMQDEDDDVVEERDPSGRFARYDQKVGKGRFKCVYKGFDEKQGIDIAWSKVLQVWFCSSCRRCEH